MHKVLQLIDTNTEHVKLFSYKFWCLSLWTLILLRWLDSLVWYLIQNNPGVSHVNLIHITQNKNQNNQINQVFAT